MAHIAQWFPNARGKWWLARGLPVDRSPKDIRYQEQWMARVSAERDDPLLTVLTSHVAMSGMILYSTTYRRNHASDRQ